MSQYKAYPKYKDSGIEWIGQVPEHWEVKPFFALVTELNRKNIGLVESNILSLSYGNIIQRPETRNLGLTPESYETYQIVEPDEIVFRFTDLQNDKRSLRSAIVTQKGIITSAYMAVKTHGVKSSYFAWIIRSYDLCKVFYAMGGGLRQSLRFEDVKRLLVLVPPYIEQRDIANAINAETTRIDALIEKKTRFIELLKEKRQALITHAVTKGLDPNVKMKDSGVEWIGQVPEEWLNRKVFHAFQTIGSGTTPPSKEHEWYQGGTIPWITTSELRENTVVKTKKCVTSDAMQKFSALKIFPAGSLAIAMYGATIGRLGFLGIPATTNQACCVLSGERDLNIQFLYYWLMAFRDYIVAFFSEGGGQPNINQEVIASLRVPSSAPDEQANIVATLDRETARIDTLVEKTKQSITLLKERRAAFITAAVTGQIDLRGEH